MNLNANSFFQKHHIIWSDKIFGKNKMFETGSQTKISSVLKCDENFEPTV